MGKERLGMRWVGREGRFSWWGEIVNMTTFESHYHLITNKITVSLAAIFLIRPDER